METYTEQKPCKRGNIAPRDKSGNCTCWACKAAVSEYNRQRYADPEIKAAIAAYHKRRYADPEFRSAAAAYGKLYRAAPGAKAAAAAYGKLYRAKYQKARYASADPRSLMLAGARHRAKKAGVPCALALEDIVVPDMCPALWVPLARGTGKLHARSPSLDRIIPALGYVTGNIAVISHRANVIKHNADAAELFSVAAWASTAALQREVQSPGGENQEQYDGAFDVLQARRQLLAGARHRAKKFGLPFFLEIEDILIPRLCPALGLPIVRGSGGVHTPNSPTLDRIAPELGYVPGNVAVISRRANAIKQNATAEEISSVAIWLDSVTTKANC